MYIGPEVAVPVSICACVAVTVIGSKWISFKRDSRVPAHSVDALQGVESRLARVEVALDDLSAELGRVAEGQQFLTKVLTDRQRESLPPGGR